MPRNNKKLCGDLNRFQQGWQHCSNRERENSVGGGDQESAERDRPGPDSLWGPGGAHDAKCHEGHKLDQCAHYGVWEEDQEDLWQK